MAISNLSLLALMSASGHIGGGSPNMYTINKNVSSSVSMSQFAVDGFSTPTCLSGFTLNGDGTPYDFDINGTSIGTKFKTHIAGVSGKVTWNATDNGFGMSIVDYGTNSAGGYHTYGFDNTGLGDAYVDVSYRVVDGFNINATDYNVVKLASFFIVDSGCFICGTNIIMFDGTYKFIEDVKIGDYILSYDFVEGIFLPKLVEKTLIHKSNEYWIINDILKVTPNHKLWVNDILSTVSKINIGDWLRNENYDKVWVYDIKKYTPEESFNTYNLKIADTHNYLAEGLLVHNKCPFVYTSYNGVETCHGTILTNFDSKDKCHKDMVSIEIPFDKIIIREIEPETSYFKGVWLNHKELLTEFELTQGNEIVLDVKNQTQISILFATGYYISY
jgi:hypothetical protein